MIKHVAILLGVSGGILAGSLLWSDTTGSSSCQSGQSCPVAKGEGCCPKADVTPVAAVEGKACCAGKADAGCAKTERVADQGCQKSCEAASGIAAQTIALQSGEGEKKGPKPKCPVMGGDASHDVSTEYRGGKVYFCCADCIEEFNKNKDKYAAKANAQLVLTKQYVQKACPLTGRPVSAQQKATVGGAEVQFCCKGCASKVQNASDQERLTMVFGNAGFEKGFEPRKKEKQG